MTCPVRALAKLYTGGERVFAARCVLPAAEDENEMAETLKFGPLSGEIFKTGRITLKFNCGGSAET